MKKEIFKFVNKNVEFSFNENFNGNTNDAVSTGYSLDWNNRVRYINTPEYRAAKLISKPGEHSDELEKALGLMQSNTTTFDSICDVFKHTKYRILNLID